jgi:hypothetical protein
VRDSDPPALPVAGVIGLTCISGGIFLWVWALMWGNWIKTVNPVSRILVCAQANIVPGVLFYINLPSLLLAIRQKDVTEIGRLHIALVLWGTIASVSLMSTYIAIFLAQRRIKK